jgi:hypothetical protein
MRLIASLLMRLIASSLPRMIASSLPRMIASSLPRLIASSLPRLIASSLPRLIAGLFAGLHVVVLAGCAGSPSRRPVDAPEMTLAQVLSAVRRAPSIRTAPPPLATAAQDVGFDNSKCEAGPDADRIDPCVFGDRASALDVVLWGDSHAGMWVPALSEIALRRHWRLQFFGKPRCPAVDLRASRVCKRFRAYVIGRIRAVRPELVVITNASQGAAPQWQAGLGRTLTTVRPRAGRLVVLGDTPVLDAGPECLANHARNVSACSTPRPEATARVWHRAEETAARRAGAHYISVLPWLCSAVCTPVISNVVVYRNRFQLTAGYARLLSGVLDEALGLPAPAG